MTRQFSQRPLLREPLVGIMLALTAVAVLAMRMLQRPTGMTWAEADARDAHIPVVNYFLTHGFDWHYPDQIAMLPGFHVLLALLAGSLGLTSVSPEGLLPFALETLFGVWTLIAVTVAVVKAGEAAPQLWLFAPLLVSSSYFLLGWAWPTTELGAFAGYASMLALLQAVWERRSVPTWREALLYAGAVLVAGAMRQSMVPLAAGLGLATAIATAPVEWRRPVVIARLALPLVAALVIVAVCFSGWHGLVPPDFARHSAHGVTVVPIFHAVALTSIVGWPFALSGARLVTGRSDWWRARSFWWLAAGAVLFALTTYLLVPLDPNVEYGRNFSLVWLVQQVGPLARLRVLSLVTMLSIGGFIWASAAAMLIRARVITPEVVLFGLYLTSLMVQAYVWQRYIEVELMFTLVIFFARSFRPSKLEAGTIFGWGLVYLAASIAKGIHG